jgi:hypothetical protein
LEAVRALFDDPLAAPRPHPARPCHLERVAASPMVELDPFFDLAVEEPQPGPGMA